MLRVLLALLVVLAFAAARHTTSISSPHRLRDSQEHTRTSEIDIYGNRVDRAVGDYRVDPRGNLYERHAPSTAILKLGPPST